MARWGRLSEKGKVLDRRGLGASVGGLGIAGVLLVLGLNFLSGTPVDLGSVLSELQGVSQQNNSIQPEEFAGNDDYENFTSIILGSNNATWEQVFKANGKDYREPTLVLFRNATNSSCGVASSAVGPHYCPADETIYLDETFFDELTRRFGAKGGDVAEAYVIAHEVGHHVQNQLGYLENAQSSNEQSIKAELQADCFAGVWAYSLKDQGIFEKNEFNEAMDAAAAVGDDNIQEKIQGRLEPESWSHGSSSERQRWLGVGFDSGDASKCTP